VFEVELNLLGTDQLYKKLHFLGYNVFQAVHLVSEYLYEEDNDFHSDSPVEIGAIRKVAGIQNICNPFFALDMLEAEGEFEYDGKSILEAAKNLSPEQTFSFKCECHENITVPQGMWPFVICPNCENKIFRKEISEVGGLYFYQKASDGKK
jgi:hypothetical protein